MAFKLFSEEEKEIEERARNHEDVILCFYESYAQWREWGMNDHTACTLALAQQQDLYQRRYRLELGEYEKEAHLDYSVRLRTKKKWCLGQTYLTRSGIRVRSKIEKIIADFLFSNGIRFEYEPILKVEGFYVMPDFYLSEFGVYLEHFGIADQHYRTSAEAKLARYDRASIRLVSTYAVDEPDIEEILVERLAQVGVFLSSCSSIAPKLMSDA